MFIELIIHLSAVAPMGADSRREEDLEKENLSRKTAPERSEDDRLC